MWGYVVPRKSKGTFMRYLYPLGTFTDANKQVLIIPVLSYKQTLVDSSSNTTAHGDALEGKWRGNWRMEWVASTLHTTSEHGLSSITTADAHTSVASSRLNWSPRRFKWTRSFRLKTKSGFCACAITLQLACNTEGRRIKDIESKYKCFMGGWSQRVTYFIRCLFRIRQFSA